MSSKQKKEVIRYAVVGLGNIAQSAVIPAFQKVQDTSHLVALVSGDKEKLHRIADQYGIQKRYLYSEFEDLLRSGEIDAVYLCTPNFFHRSLMETAAKFGVHVLCEKPMAVTTRDCAAMIQTSQMNHTHLMVAYRLHFQKYIQDTLQIIRSKAIGDVKIFQSHFTIDVKDQSNIRLESEEKGGGPLYDIGIYCINLARHIFGSEPIEVIALGSRTKDSRFSEVDETISATMKFSQGRVATFVVSLGANPTNSFDLIGTKGRLQAEHAYGYERSVIMRTFIGKKIITKRYPKKDQFVPEVQHLSDCIINGKSPEPNGLEGLRDIKVIEALHLSLDLASPITLDEVDRRNKTETEKPHRAFLPRLFHFGEKH